MIQPFKLIFKIKGVKRKTYFPRKIIYLDR